MADPTFACPCLNVRLYEKRIEAGDAEAKEEEGWRRIFVGDEGIQITHVDMTLRTRSIIQPPPEEQGQAMCSTLLTCLACRTPAYRTAQKLSWPLDSGGISEGPIVPSDDWIETEVLKSGDGWIDVNVSSPGCITGVSMATARASSRFSSTFSLLIPESTPSIPSDLYESSIALEAVLPKLPTLFPPPPQTPSHPMFQHLAMIASAASNDARQKAEEELSALVRQRLEELQQLDLRLRREVELLWSSWKDSRQTLPGSSRTESDNRRQRELEASSPSVSRVTDFIPSAATRDTSSERQRALSREASSVSLLSMSLRTGGLMYQPGTQFETDSQPGEESESAELSIPTTPDEDNIDNTIEHSIPVPAIRVLTGSSHLEDVALSLRLSQMKPRGRAMSRSVLEPIEEKSPMQPESGRTALRGRVGVEEVAAALDRDRTASQERSSQERTSRERDRTPKSRSRVDEMRPKHVTFEEDKGTTPKSSKERKSRKVPEEEEPIFDFDPDAPSQPERKKSKTPYETVVPSRKGKSAELTRTLPQLSTNGTASQPGMHPSYFNLPRNLPRPHKLDTDAAALTSRVPSTEAKLKELVGGYLPSHRSAWKDGKGWDLYSRVFQEKSPLDGSEEDFEDGASSATSSQPQSVPGATTSKTSIAASAPIDISPIARRARYHNLELQLEPKTSLVERKGVLVPALRPVMRKENGKEETPTRRKRSTSATRRNENYARRDLNTHVDPGPIFEFSSSTEDDGAEFDGLSASEKARLMATEMQGTSDGLPDAGMWRSMADS